jgi:hypothetical protein
MGEMRKIERNVCRTCPFYSQTRYGERRSAAFAGPPSSFDSAIIMRAWYCHSRTTYLHPSNRTQNQNCAIEHPQSPFYFYCEIDVSWRIYNIDCVFLFGGVDGTGCLPVAERRRALDGDSLFALQVHAVHFGANRVAAADLQVAVLDG